MYDLQLVIPTYNESACIEKVLSDWEQTLDVLQINYRIIVINDGSRDKTESILLRYNGNPKYLIINKRNSGHGPTILHGYRLAVNDSYWIFQVDSDNEIAAQHFVAFWSQRNHCDACIGVRNQRQQPLSRRIVSIAAFLIIRLFYGKGIQDVNCPYRLIKADALLSIIDKIPEGTFAPNVIISGLLLLHKKHVKNIPVIHHLRKTGTVSIKKWALLYVAIKSCLQTISARLYI